MTLLTAEPGDRVRVGALVLGRVADRADAEDEALAGMSRGTEWTVPIVPGLVIVPVVPAKSSGEILLDADLADELLVRGEEAGEVERRRRP